MEALARRGGLTPRAREPLKPPAVLENAGGNTLDHWLDAAAAWLGLEVEPVFSTYAEVEHFTVSASPALLRLPGLGQPHFLALLNSRRRRVGWSSDHVVVFAPDQRLVSLPARALASALRAPVDAELQPEIAQLLESAGIPAARRARAATALRREQAGDRRIAEAWLLRLPPGASPWRLLRQSRLAGRLAGLLGAHALEYLVFLLAWAAIGQGALAGRLDPGWVLAWALLLLTQIPLRLFATWSAGLLALDAGALLKQRLLFGAIRLEPEEIRHQGAGQLLGRVIESEAVEGLAVSGGFAGLFAAVELVLALFVLGAGAAGPLHSLLLILWTAAMAEVARRYVTYRRRWTMGGRRGDFQAGRRVGRLGMTHDLIERMSGHRTRLAQEARERWHEEEDLGLERYSALSQAMDHAGVRLAALPGRGWLLVGLAALAPALASGASSILPFAISVGGVLIAYGALRQLAASVASLTDAWIAWEQAGPLFRAAEREETPGLPDFALAPTTRPADTSVPLLDARDLTFRYADRNEPVLRGCSLRIARGDRILLEGSSGGGKSTLASILVGLRPTQGGLLLLHGLDRRTLGAEGWRHGVVAAPQFHENHVFTGTFAFNLLMGRRWPASFEDMAEADRLCRALGLDELLDRMPAGMLQMVGETGWQLSHGERSRLFMARALLQGADLMIFDESFGALDPQNLGRCLRVVLAEAPALAVIAHP